jgi:hypothetical protein
MWRMRKANCQAELPPWLVAYIAPSNDFVAVLLCLPVVKSVSQHPLHLAGSWLLIMTSQKKKLGLVTLFVPRFHYTDVDGVRGQAAYISLSCVLFR